MDGQQFDRWARRFAAASSRRGLLKGLAGSLAAGLVVAGVEEAEAAQLCRRKPNGTRCRECGVCRNETCVVDATVRCAGCQRCHADSLTCRATDDACATCEKCERDGSEYRCKPLKCTDKQRCCNHRCISEDHCCTGRDCPECGTCERGRCRRAPETEGQRCGTRDCHVCKNGECVNQTNNANCFDGNGQCCDGVCCAAGKSCCGHSCCTTGLCLGDVCCDPRGFSATGADICCPFGPPCGEGNNARCCQEGERCCEGRCQLGSCECGGGNDDFHCPDDTCCSLPEVCSNDGCCDLTTTEWCCANPGYHGGNCDGPCCDGETERCCGNDSIGETWCCPKVNTAGGGVAFNCVFSPMGSCCPPAFPQAEAIDGDTYCCPDRDYVFPDDCTQTYSPGRG
jgi:hypothetical protein